MIIVFTICSNNYLAQAITLGDSLKKHNPDYLFKIGLVDKKIAQIDYSAIPYEIIEVENIGISCFDEMFKRYNITELNTAVKPYYFQYFFKNQDSNNIVIYLDPDIYVYHNFNDLEAVLESNEIVITPHFTTPINDNYLPSENNILNTGIYNLGFIALKKSEETTGFVNWWANRLTTKSYVNLAKGMFTDQLWINFVPLFFENVHIFKNAGYNIAYWNLHERQVVDNKIVVKSNIAYPLVFFHFSGFNPQKPNILSVHQDRFTFENRQDISKLFLDYSENLFKNGYDVLIKCPNHYITEKNKIDLAAYIANKNKIPFYKRAIRGLLLRLINWFNINIDYYISKYNYLEKAEN
jgi:hypothetical protein